jgi:glutathione S-transferase
MAELVALPYSPWSEKARWALDHHRVPYRFREYVPMLFEPWLRARLRQPLGRVSVPVFIGDGAVLRDSFSIARHADRVGAGPRLFPDEQVTDIVAWNERSEGALAAGRVVVVRRLGEMPGALTESLPKFIPEALRPRLGGMTTMALGFLRSKYDLGGDLDASETTIRAALEGLRGALRGRPYLLGELSYADMAMAVVLQLVRPVEGFVPLGPAQREAWGNAELARSFGDLLEWRDALYAKHRRA